MEMKMSVLNAEQRKYIDGKMNTFLSMEDFKHTTSDVVDLMNKICKKKKFSINPKYASFNHGPLDSGKIHISFNSIEIPLPIEVKRMMDIIKKEKERRSKIVKSIREKMVFGAQADEIKSLLAMLK